MAEQTEGFTDIQKEQYSRILAFADKVECCSERKATGIEKKRNERLVELSDYCVCYCNEKRKRSGTAQTVRMARKKGIGVYNFYADNPVKKKSAAMHSTHYDKTFAKFALLRKFVYCQF